VHALRVLLYYTPLQPIRNGQKRYVSKGILVKGLALGGLYWCVSMFFAFSEKTGYWLIDIKSFLPSGVKANLWNHQANLFLVAIFFGWLIFKFAKKEICFNLLGFSFLTFILFSIGGGVSFIPIALLDVGFVLFGFSTFYYSNKYIFKNQHN